MASKETFTQHLAHEMAQVVVHTIHAERAGFHRATGTVDGEVAVHTGFLRDAEKLSVEHPQHGACMLG